MTSFLKNMFDSDWDLSSLLSSMYISNRALSTLDTDDVLSSLDRSSPVQCTSVDMCQGYTVPIIYKDETWDEIERKKEKARISGSALPAGNDLPWKARKNRIDNALAWLRTELETMRAQDKALLGQLQRCQQTIESIKHQRSLWEEGSEGDFDECDEEHWEDWEISEFDRMFVDGSEYSSSTLSSKDSRSSGYTSTSGISSMASQRSARSDTSDKSPYLPRSTLNTAFTVSRSKTTTLLRQDLEVTV